jgi:hypothetical protein
MFFFVKPLHNDLLIFPMLFVFIELETTFLQKKIEKQVHTHILTYDQSPLWTDAHTLYPYKHL